MKIKYILLITLFSSAVLTSCISPHLRSARISMNERTWERAIGNLEQELAINPQNAEALWRMGECYREMEDWTKMVEYFDKSLAVSNEFSSKITESRARVVKRFGTMAIANYDSARWDAALKNLTIALLVEPSNYFLYQQAAVTAYNGEMADSSYKGQMLEKAVDYAQKAIEYEADTAKPDINMREILLVAAIKMGKDDEAVKWATLLLELADPNESKATYLSSIDAVVGAYEKAGNFDEAIQILDRGIANFPDITELSINKAILLDRKKDTEGAIAVYKGILGRDPGNLKAHLNIGVLYLEQEKFGEAIPHLEKVHDADPNDLVIIKNLMAAYYNSGDVQKGEQMVKKVKAIEGE